MIYSANSITDLEQISQDIIIHLKYPVICFYGQMGAGKTTLIKKIVAGLGSKDSVSSPTFSIVNEYLDKDQNPIYHFDFYRLNHENEALDFGLEEYLDSNYICLMEWPDKIANFVPENHHTIKIQLESDAHKNNSRIISLDE